jgi:alpha-1,2-mannosyltransferase
MSFFNQRRLRDYPRLLLGTMIFILLLNILLRQGWMGAVKKIIGGDFIAFYSAGVIFNQDINSLYDLQKQGAIQRDLLAPTPFEGVMPFFYPPYVAPIISIFTNLPMSAAFIVWTLLTVACVTLAVFLTSKYLVPNWLYNHGLSFSQLIIITCSFFPFILGLQVGQNHGLTLLLLTGMVVCSIKEKWFLSGLIAGLTIYKPQFAIGFLILWVVWGQYKALIGFAISSFLWAGWFVLNNGFYLFKSYTTILPIVLKMLYLKGFAGEVEVTPYGLLITVLPPEAWSGIMLFTQSLSVFLGIGLAFIAFRLRKQPIDQRQSALILAILFPLLASPHTLIYDLLIIIPVLVLWSHQTHSVRLLYACIAIYLGSFLLPLAIHMTGIALSSFIPITLLVAQIRLILLERKYRNNAKGIL